MMKMECRLCGIEVEIPMEDGFTRIAEIQAFQCPAAKHGQGHWLRGVR